MGTALYLLLTALLWRAVRWSPRPENSTRFSLLALLWNASNLIAYSSLLAGFTTESKAFYLPMAFAYSATVMLPTSLLLDLKSPQVKSARRRLIGKWAVRASYLIGALLTIGIFATISSRPSRSSSRRSPSSRLITSGSTPRFTRSCFAKAIGPRGQSGAIRS